MDGGQRHAGRASKWAPPLLVAAAWLISTLAAHHLGLALQADLGRSWQVLDLGALRDHLGQSLWYQHSQPPLWNLLIGGLLRAGVDPGGALVHAAFDAVGLAIALLTWRTAIGLGAGRWWAALAACLLLASPGFALTIHWLFYDAPVTLGILALLLSLAAAADRPTLPRLAALTLTVAGLVWLRSVFHFAWLLGLLALVLADRALPRRRLLGALAVALLLATLPFVKNAAVFGTFSSSSWAGMSVQRLTKTMLSPAELQAEIAAGQLAPSSAVGPFQPLERYGPLPKVPADLAAIAVLSAPHKATGETNFNHYGYLELSRQMAGDAVRLALRHPGAYLRAHAAAWLQWLRPTALDTNLGEGRKVLRPWVDVWDHLVLLDVGQVFVLLALGALLALALLVDRLRPRTVAQLPAPQRALWRAAAWTALWITLLGNAVEYGENYRFRAYIDPLLLATLAVAATQLQSRLRRP
ncbi:MAG: hypothetical protein HY902_11285 [Deltaproteobacteria bacterium]|nr:hypothetical protein [Deltaproteobacteria bacterium]